MERKERKGKETKGNKRDQKKGKREAKTKNDQNHMMIEYNDMIDSATEAEERER
jgi:hypothetical protein